MDFDSLKIGDDVAIKTYYHGYRLARVTGRTKSLVKCRLVMDDGSLGSVESKYRVERGIKTPRGESIYSTDRLEFYTDEIKTAIEMQVIAGNGSSALFDLSRVSSKKVLTKEQWLSIIALRDKLKEEGVINAR